MRNKPGFYNHCEKLLYIFGVEVQHGANHQLDYSCVTSRSNKDTLQYLTCLLFSQRLVTLLAACTCTLHLEGPTLPTCPFYTNLRQSRGVTKQLREKESHNLLLLNRHSWRQLKIYRNKENKMIFSSEHKSASKIVEIFGVGSNRICLH